MPNNLNAALQPDFEGNIDQLLISLKELDGNKNMHPEELRTFLENFIKSFEKIEQGEFKIVFPKVFKVQNTDVGGFAMTDVLKNFASLQHYEPPIVRARKVEGEIEEELEVEVEMDELPSWLQGYENLFWKGASKNPLWKVEAKTYDDQIKISYRRGNAELRPGKTKFDQARELKDVKHVFSREEWQIIEPVIEEYLKFKEAHDKNPAGVSQETKKEILAILREERNWVRGKTEETPTLLRVKIEESLNKVAKVKRWGKEKISGDKISELTQATAEILSQLIVLNATRAGSAEMIPKRDPSIKEIPTFVEALNKFMICLDYQMGQEGYPPKGFTLLLGEPGVGKNELVKYVATMTNRPFFWFPCGRGMEAQDLVHHYEFDSKEGTKRFFTSLAEGLQTPGALIMIDEANALKPQVQAILHGLGDSNRTLKYDGIEIPVAEGVMIVIAGNPATQGSAGNFGEPILSRTRGQAMIMEYPALTRSDLVKRQEYLSDERILEMEQKDNTLKEYLCDEALALYPTFNEFSGLNDLEFEYVWQRVLNERHLPMEDAKFAGLDRIKLETYITLNEKQVRDLLVDLRDILRISDQWRKKFEKRELVLGLSMRDTLALVQAYKKLRNVKKAYLRIFDDFRKNPIDGLDVMFIQIGEIVDDVLKVV